MKSVIAIALVGTLGVLGCTSSNELEVRVDGGTVRGAKTGTMRSWLGIPYAAPPLGGLRWRVPQPVVPWHGVLDVKQVSDPCPQTFLGSSDNEDCLYLNVWSPSGAHGLPVMVWIHGGAFVSGSGGDKWYAGAQLAQQGAVIVTLNYRLGALGFMAHPALDVDDPGFPTSGNYGLEDQRAALAWVQKNIAAFGGDPKRVTLFGESAGGFSTCVQYLSNRTTGLFAAAISESGLCGATIIAPGHASADSLGLDLGKQLGCPGSDATALACLRNVGTDAILAATALPPVSSQTPGGPIYQASVLSDVLPNVDGYVIAAPLRAAFAAGGFEPRPLVIGNVKDEGTLFHSTVYANQVLNETDYRAALAVRFTLANVDAIVAHYPVASFASANDALAAVTGDAFFVCPSRQAARGALAAGAPVWRYSFDQPLSNPFEQGLGVFHSSELPFVFGNDDFPLGQIGGNGDLSSTIQSYWTTFAKTYTPGADWPAYDATTEMLRVLDEPAPSTSAKLKAQLCDFWDQVAASLS